jgi:hypothetical protein
MRFYYALLASTALLLTCRLINAQSSSSSLVGIPSLGFVYDGNLNAIRPILGVPGAATVGAPLDIGFAVAHAAAAAQLRFVLATSVDDGRVRLARIQQSAPMVRLIDGALVSPDRMVLSPSGRAALLYSQNTARLQIITGLPDAPAVTEELAADGLGSAADLAVSDDGAVVLFVADSNSVWLFNSNSGWMQISIPGVIAAVCFRPDGSDGLAISRSGELYTIQAGGATSYYGQIAVDQTSNPVAIRLSRDGRRAHVAYAEGWIAEFDSASGLLKTISCDCRPTALDPVNSAAVFRVNDLSTGPVMLFDGSGANLRMWFVPIDRPLSGAQENAR